MPPEERTRLRSVDEPREKPAGIAEPVEESTADRQVPGSRDQQILLESGSGSRGRWRSR